MSFTVIIQRNESETIRFDKTLVTLLTLTGTLKAETSITNPVIIIEADLATLKNANYLTVESFGRSYFINDITSYRNNLVEISCHVDVLSSFKSQIRANKGIVFRQENDWNLYLNDGVLEVYQNPIVTTHEFPNGFNGESYILALAGRSSGGIVPGSGAGNSDAKSCAGLYAYALAQIGNPYWFGTFGQIADASLLNNRRSAYPSYYTDTDFPNQYGQRVHDCAGLIKGYRWSETPNSVPVYNAAQDIDIESMYAECSRVFGAIGDSNWNSIYKAYPGVCLFNRSFTHMGVSVGDGNGNLIEAKSHADGVLVSNISDYGRTWSRWGIPDWMIDAVGIPAN